MPKLNLKFQIAARPTAAGVSQNKMPKLNLNFKIADPPTARPQSEFQNFFSDSQPANFPLSAPPVGLHMQYVWPKWGVARLVLHILQNT